jgi:hypothetical protein
MTAKKYNALVLALTALGITVLVKAWLGPEGEVIARAEASDIKIDCVLLGDDAGTTAFITLPGGSTQVMLRSEGYSSRYRIGNGSGTVAIATDSVLDADKSIDLCVDPVNGTRLSVYRQYDGGVAQACAYKVKPRTLPCNQP